MNIPVDVIAVFNTQGKIKPCYVRLEDTEHALHTYKIEHVEYDKNEKIAGIYSILFLCKIIIEDCMHDIKLRYHTATHQWVFVS